MIEFNLYLELVSSSKNYEFWNKFTCFHLICQELESEGVIHKRQKKDDHLNLPADKCLQSDLSHLHHSAVERLLGK
jgi:hypothetical protein